MFLYHVKCVGRAAVLKTGMVSSFENSVLFSF